MIEKVGCRTPDIARPKTSLNAIGNALGNSIVGAIEAPSTASASTQGGVSPTASLGIGSGAPPDASDTGQTAHGVLTAYNGADSDQIGADAGTGLVPTKGDGFIYSLFRIK